MTDIDRYAAANPDDGLPEQGGLITSRANFTEAYAYIPRSSFCDIVTSRLPHWSRTRAWIIARPMSGFATTFSQYIVEIGSGGGSDMPEGGRRAEGVLFVTAGAPEITIEGISHSLTPGSYVYINNTRWQITNPASGTAIIHWIRKCYVPVEGIPPPGAFVAHEDDVEPMQMYAGDDVWTTKRFVDAEDMAHDMHVNVITFGPGGCIPLMETHVMEHGLFVLGGKAVYRLNQDWVEVGAGDFMWLRAFCPQACYAVGKEDFRYLLYKDVNRHPELAVG
ncbi:MAG: bifunctional allantoicase/(S)-ureidoglycine aminohydrolase [Rhodobacteraceae bacterium]|nr:bifunctional allantoicase/(S)-ureidoglycine aminohydrolase [Paracoccaceae bacterium]